MLGAFLSPGVRSTASQGDYWSMPGGRPTLYSPEMAARICELVSSNRYGLHVLAADYDWMPSPSTIDRWQDQHPEFCVAFVRAREARGDLLFDEGLTIADDTGEDHKVIRDKSGELVAVVDHEAIARSALRVKVRQDMAARLKPKVYGNKQFIEHSGSIEFTGSSDEELVAELFELARTGHLVLPPGGRFDELPDEEDFSDLA